MSNYVKLTMTWLQADHTILARVAGFVQYLYIPVTQSFTGGNVKQLLIVLNVRQYCGG
jgi:hypothetical protein